MRRAMTFKMLSLAATVFASSATFGDDPASGPAAAVELAFVDAASDGRSVESIALRVTTGGEVQVPVEGGALRTADRMQPDQLAGLLQELEQTGRLRAIDNQKLREELRRACQAAGLSETIAGAGETVIRVNSAAGRVEVRCQALAVMAARFPDFSSVQRLLSVQLRLQNVAAVARAGGEQAARRLADMANPSLRADHPDLQPLTGRDLSMVRSLSAGSRYVQFYRAPTATSDELLVSVFELPGEPARVSVLRNPGGGRMR